MGARRPPGTDRRQYAGPGDFFRRSNPLRTDSGARIYFTGRGGALAGSSCPPRCSCGGNFQRRKPERPRSLPLGVLTAEIRPGRPSWARGTTQIMTQKRRTILFCGNGIQGAFRDCRGQSAFGSREWGHNLRQFWPTAVGRLHCHHIETDWRKICRRRAGPKRLEGRRVRVRGFVEERGGPWIEATAPEQFEIADSR